ncbi:uncharacterized protein UTRI_02949 [Ustilago trichophora]|uniref:Uncharacterized protein n=1 Tax=Ustilago trichophora TaxID=86804 RepID=A0A5C3EPM0_9BASI|nr:uncharacterized protein UTRI_02949 [Ustilago trichophora]
MHSRRRLGESVTDAGMSMNTNMGFQSWTQGATLVDMKHHTLAETSHRGISIAVLSLENSSPAVTHLEDEIELGSSTHEKPLLQVHTFDLTSHTRQTRSDMQDASGAATHSPRVLQS